VAEQFKEQGGVATMDPSYLKRWLTSRVMTRLSRPAAVAARHDKAEQARLRSSEPHRVEYFHQVDEGYSALTAQILERFVDRYDIELVCHVVRGQEGKTSKQLQTGTRGKRKGRAHRVKAFIRVHDKK
jgi:hypothetical protein